MKKFFIYFITILALFISNNALSGVKSISDPVSYPAIDINKHEKELKKLYKEIPDLNDKKAVEKYIKQRIKKVSIAKINKEEIATPSSTSIIDLHDKTTNNDDNTLSAYDKIYNQRMQQALSTNTINENLTIEGTFYREKTIAPQKFVPDFPYVTIKLSKDKEILAPQEEHIAYLLTTINIKPIGLINVTEEFVFVSNNEGFPQGFFRILPKYTYSRTGQRRRFDLTLDSVTINDTEYQYKITEVGNHLYIEPKSPINLPTGIYTYKFNYTIDRSIWQYSQYDEFYWDITAKTIKNVIGSANALVILPKDKTFLAQNAITSTSKGFDYERVTINSLSENSLGFADTEALAVGDDIHVLITLDKDTLLPPTLTQKYFWFIQDFGAELFAILAFLAIFIGYKISLKQIHRNQDKTRAKIKKTPSIWRMINQNVFDNHSLGAEILNLYTKNIIDIIERDNIVTLVKKTDNLSRLTRSEIKFMSHLFPQTETILSSTKESILKLKRAYNYLKQHTYKEVFKFKLKLNRFYLIFSFLMLLLGILSASMLSINPYHTFWILFISTYILSVSILLLTKTFKNRPLNILLKLISLSLIITTGALMSVYTSKLYVSIIIFTIYIIFYYNKLFSRRSGLMRSKIKETEDYKTYLQKNTELTTEARDFISKIPYIYAFNIESKYPQTAIFDKITKLTNVKG